MQGAEEFLKLDDQALLAQCRQDVYKSSGPGGQHRNKVSSAVRLRHEPTGITVHGDDSRSQHDNRRVALGRLRRAIACGVRRDAATLGEPPPAVAELIFQPKGRPADAPRRLAVGRKDRRFWSVTAWLLDVLDARQGRLAEAAETLGITSSNIVSILQADGHVLAAAQEIRRRHGQKPLK